LFCYSFRDDKGLLPKGEGGIFALAHQHLPISICIFFFLFSTINTANYNLEKININFFGKTLENS